MERNANYALVGITSTVVTIGLVLFILWLGAFQVGKTVDAYDIVFEGPVRGLSQGGEVHFNGIRVGEVTDLSFDRDDPTLIIARVRVDSDIPVRIDSRARLEPQGITGLNYILITAGSPTLPLLKDSTSKEKVPRILAEPGMLSNLLDGGATVLARADESLERLNRLLTQDNIDRISSTLNDLQIVAAELREHRAIIGEAEAAIVRANEAIEHINALAAAGSELVEKGGRDSVASLGSAASRLDSMMSSLEHPVKDFATTGLPQVMSAVASLQQAVDQLDRTLAEVQQSPQGLVARPPAQEIEVKP